jgi:hypothetical protein
LVDPIKKLFIETYVDILLSAALNYIAFYRTEDNEEFMEFFGSFDDILSSSLTYILYPLVFIAPMHMAYVIYKNFENI